MEHILTYEKTTEPRIEAKLHPHHLTHSTQRIFDEKKIAQIRHALAEEAEQSVHTLTIITTAANLAIESPQLKAAEIVVATTGLTLTFLHALHHKYQKQAA